MMLRNRKLFLTVLLLLTCPTNSSSQSLARVPGDSRPNATLTFGTVQQAESPRDDQSLPELVISGAGMGAAGFLVGGLAAAAIASGCSSDEFCAVNVALTGAAAGGTFGMALGVHLSNKRKGNFALDVLAGAAVGLGAFGIAVATSDGKAIAGPVLVAIPIAQLGAIVAVERATARARSRAR